MSDDSDTRMLSVSRNVISSSTLTVIIISTVSPGASSPSRTLTLKTESTPSMNVLYSAGMRDAFFMRSRRVMSPSTGMRPKSRYGGTLVVPPPAWAAFTTDLDKREPPASEPLAEPLI